MCPRNSSGIVFYAFGLRPAFFADINKKFKSLPAIPLVPQIVIKPETMVELKIKGIDNDFGEDELSAIILLSPL